MSALDDFDPELELRSMVEEVPPSDIYAVMEGLLAEGVRDVTLSRGNFEAFTARLEAALKNGTADRSMGPTMRVRADRFMPDTRAIVDGFPRFIGIRRKVSDG